jgi:RimJ/RimL family protein N-acetyltransferase
MELAGIGYSDYEDIHSLVSLKSVMKYIANGEVWGREKTTNFIISAIADQKTTDKERVYFYYKIVNSEKDFVGIIGFFRKSGQYNLRVFLNPLDQGKGYFSQSLKLLMEKMKKHKNEDLLYAQSHVSNLKMNHILAKKFYFDKKTNIGKIEVNQYIIFGRKNTYLFQSNYMSVVDIRNVFDKRGNWEAWDGKGNPDFVHIDGFNVLDRKHENLNSYLKNLSDSKKRAITDKSMLFKNLSSKKYIPKTYFYEKNTTDDINKYRELFQKSGSRVWILKPDKAYSGRGIALVQTFDKMKEWIKTNKYKVWSIQEYLTDIALIDDRKFHLRVLFLCRDDGKCFWFKKIPVYRAQKPFVLGDFGDEKIHISHYSEEDAPMYFLENFMISKEEKNKIVEQMENIFRDLKSLLKIGCYTESRHCYEIFGADFILDSKFDLKLLEINEKIGLKEFTNDPYQFNKKLLDAELSVSCDHYFPPHHSEKNNLFKEI